METEALQQIAELKESVMYLYLAMCVVIFILLAK